MNTDSAHFIGIDGGGTSCRARISDSSNNILGEAKAGSANVFQNHQIAWASVQEAIRLANIEAGLTDHALRDSYIVAGLAGAEVPECAEQFKALVTGFSHFTLLTDAQIACLGAHGGEDGAIFIIGTGAIGLSLNQGTWSQISGWGFPLDDIGSGAWLGQQAIRTAIRQEDGTLPDGPLAQSIWSHFENNRSKLIQWSQKATSGDFGFFAPLVLEAAKAGDNNAASIINEQIETLTHQINALVTNDLPLSLMGGLSDWVAGNLPMPLQQRLSPTQGDALSGALLFAQKRNIT
jgi:glucosamine kinase